MCNEVARRIALGLLREDWADLRIPLRFPEGLPNLAPLASIRITDPALILRAGPAAEGAEPGVDAVTRRWSWPGPGGRPVYNYRSEGRRFANTDTSGRCLVVVDAFYEFTDPARGARRKTKWAFADARHPWFGIAGLWRRDPAVGEAFTLLTGEPGPDVAPYHHRQVLCPPRALWGGWLDGSLPVDAVARPRDAGTFAVTPA